MAHVGAKKKAALNMRPCAIGLCREVSLARLCEEPVADGLIDLLNESLEQLDRQMHEGKAAFR